MSGPRCYFITHSHQKCSSQQVKSTVISQSKIYKEFNRQWTTLSAEPLVTRRERKDLWRSCGKSLFSVRKPFAWRQSQSQAKSRSHSYMPCWFLYWRLDFDLRLVENMMCMLPKLVWPEWLTQKIRLQRLKRLDNFCRASVSRSLPSFWEALLAGSQWTNFANFTCNKKNFMSTSWWNDSCWSSEIFITGTQICSFRI